jgi:hypothetical protein
VSAPTPQPATTPYTQQSSAQTSTTSEPSPMMQGDFANPRKPLDMCLRIGRLSVTERIGGQLRANIVHSLDHVLQSHAYDVDQIDSYSAPIVAWFKPHNTLPIGQILSSGLSWANDFFCNDLQQQALIDKFFIAVHPVCHVVTRSDLKGTDSLTLALRSSVFFAASASMGIYQCSKIFGMTKESLCRKLKASAESALSRGELLGCIDLKAFQALVVYLTTQMTSEISRAFSVFVAMLIRQFQIAGFDRESTNDSEIVRQTKRHLWQQLLFLNLRAVEAIGPETTLLDDPASALPALDSDASVVAAIRYECYKIHRFIFSEREKVTAGDMSCSELLTAVEGQVEIVRTRLLHLLDEKVPLQKYARMVGELLLARCTAMLLVGLQHKWKETDEAEGMLRK